MLENVGDVDSTSSSYWHQRWSKLLSLAIALELGWPYLSISIRVFWPNVIWLQQVRIQGAIKLSQIDRYVLGRMVMRHSTSQFLLRTVFAKESKLSVWRLCHELSLWLWLEPPLENVTNFKNLIFPSSLLFRLPVFASLHLQLTGFEVLAYALLRSRSRRCTPCLTMPSTWIYLCSITCLSRYFKFDSGSVCSRTGMRWLARSPSLQFPGWRQLTGKKPKPVAYFGETLYDLYDLYAQYEMTAAATEQNLTHSVVSNVLTAMTLQLPQWQVCTCDMLQIQQAWRPEHRFLEGRLCLDTACLQNCCTLVTLRCNIQIWLRLEMRTKLNRTSPSLAPNMMRQRYAPSDHQVLLEKVICK